MASASRPRAKSAPFTVYLAPHSHCDLGYTHDLPVVMEITRRHIDTALELCEATRHLPPGERFCWTCESAFIVRHWLKSASARDIKRFQAANCRGQMEVCALWSNLTPLASLAQMVQMLDESLSLRSEYGLVIETAMQSDVNGIAWAWTDLLKARGIMGLTMAINEHFGSAPKPHPRFFNWQTPTGDTMPVYSGTTYAHSGWMEIANDTAKAFKNIVTFIEGQRADGWKWPWTYLQFTQYGVKHDNVGPSRNLAPWIVQFNKRYGDRVRLEITTPGQLFRRMGHLWQEAPTLSGEWNDWWSFGEGSTTFEVALFRRALAQTAEGDALEPLSRPKNFAPLRAQLTEALEGYAEHTWGADCSVSEPTSDDTRVQNAHKAAFAYDAHSYAKLLRRDGLAGLAARVKNPSAKPAVVLFNPSAHPQTVSARVPRRVLESINLSHEAVNVAEKPAQWRWPRDEGYTHFVDRPSFCGSDIVELSPVTLPPFGWTTLNPSDTAKPAPRLQATQGTITNGRISLHWDGASFGLSAIRLGARAAVRPSFGNVLFEKVTTGNRRDLFKMDDARMPAIPATPVWNPAPPIARSWAAPTSTRIEDGKRYKKLVREAAIPGARSVRAEWTIFADSDDVALSVVIDKLPDAAAHALYLSLPFAFAGAPATRLAQTPGLWVDPRTDALPNGCPWHSLQNGFCMGEASAAAYAAIPDVPLAIFEKLPFGESAVDGQPLADPALAFSWLYNNYWETNFKADEQGVLRFEFRFRFTDAPVDLAEADALVARATHPVAFHPLPYATPEAPAKLPPSGALFAVEPSALTWETLYREPSGAHRLVVSNPTDTPQVFRMTSSVLPLRGVHLIQGEKAKALPLSRKNTFAHTVPARTVCQFRLRF